MGHHHSPPASEIHHELRRLISQETLEGWNSILHVYSLQVLPHFLVWLSRLSLLTNPKEKRRRVLRQDFRLAIRANHDAPSNFQKIGHSAIYEQQ